MSSLDGVEVALDDAGHLDVDLHAVVDQEVDHALLVRFVVCLQLLDVNRATCALLRPLDLPLDLPPFIKSV